MTKHTDRDVIDHALNLLQHPNRWCQGDYALTDDGTPCEPTAPEARQWCLLGAIERGAAAYGLDHRPAIAFLRHAAYPGQRGAKIADWNDDPERTHSQVITLLRNARDSLEPQQ